MAERETVTDDSQGVRLAMMQDLARYWANDYDWGSCEAKLNALHQDAQLVIPSPPGHGFSAKPTATGWDPAASPGPGPC